MKIVIGGYKEHDFPHDGEVHTVSVHWSLAGVKGKFDIDCHEQLSDVLDKVCAEYEKQDPEQSAGFVGAI